MLDQRQTPGAPLAIDIYSPIPPAKSGVAHYIHTLFGHPVEGFDVRLATDQEEPRPGAVPIYQIANNPDHEFVLNTAFDFPGLIEIHDFSVHHLLTDMTLARNDNAGYLSFLTEAHGDTGRVFALNRFEGVFDEAVEFEVNALPGLIRKSRGVIVHSRWARQKVRLIDPQKPVWVIPHFCLTPEEAELDDVTDASAPLPAAGARKSLRILIAGFVTQPKRVDLVIRAAMELLDENDDIDVHIDVAGEIHDEVAGALIDSVKHPQMTIIKHGYLDDKQFDDCFLQADVVPAMRYPSVGEASGVASRAIGFGIWVLAPYLKSFADLPEVSTKFFTLGRDRHVVADIARCLKEVADETERDKVKRIEQTKVLLDAELSVPRVREMYRDVLGEVMAAGQE